jgi:hypothetical protein
MRRKPKEYQTPLRSRAEIVAFINDATEGRVYDNQGHPFCFNVKVQTIDLDFDTLLAYWRKINPKDNDLNNAEWIEAARAEYNRIEDSLCDFAFECARNYYSDEQNGEPASPVLYDGTKVDVAYSFEGRSCGWLSVNRFEGIKFVNTEIDYRKALADTGDDEVMDYATLRKFYALIVMLSYDLSHRQLVNEITHHAASLVFSSVEVPA